MTTPRALMRENHPWIQSAAALAALATLAGAPALAAAPVAGGHALIISGGCETPTPDNVSRTGHFADTTGAAAGHWNLFKPEVQTTVDALANNGWDTRVLYATDAWEHPWPNSGPLTRKAIFDELKIRIKQAKPGEQFLVSINTHGSIDPHAICLGDHTLLKVSDLASDLKTLAGKGVKVAVVDTSCYSGASIKALSGTGACVLTGGPATVTGAGDTIVPYLFGPGLPAGTPVSSYYTQAIPKANLDLDGDGLVSAAEAFDYARVNAKSPGLPLTSDCALDARGLRDLLEGSAPLLRVLTNCSREDKNGDEAQPQSSDACKIASTGLAFEGLVASGLTPSTIAQTQLELGLLGTPADAPSVTEVARNLRVDTSKLATLLAGHIKDQDTADALIEKNRPVPDDLKTRLQAADHDAYDLKFAIFGELRPLLQLACDAEKASRPTQPRPCESFMLYRRPQP